MFRATVPTESMAMVLDFDVYFCASARAQIRLIQKRFAKPKIKVAPFSAKQVVTNGLDDLLHTSKN